MVRSLGAVATVVLFVVLGLSGCLSDDAPEAAAPEDLEPTEASDGNTTASNTTGLNETVEPAVNVTPVDPTFTTVDGASLRYIIDLPDTPTDTLVLFAHGIGHSVDSHRNHTAEVASWGVAAASIDYRDNLGFPILWGAQDLMAARDHLHATHGPFNRTILVSFSMGGAVGGTAIAESDGLFDVWFVAEGLSATYESWAEACALGPGIEFAATVCEQIEVDAGRTDTGEAGTPCAFPECPDAYFRRSPVTRAAEMTELTEAFVLHGAFDGLVPYDQGAQMAQALEDAGITTHFTTILRGEEGTDQDTTPTSHGLGKESDVDKAHGLSGHGTESDRAQAIVATTMEQLEAYLADGSVRHGDVVDRR